MTPSISVNTAVFPPIPSASVRTQTNTKPGAFRSRRSAAAASDLRLLNVRTRASWMEGANEGELRPCTWTEAVDGSLTRGYFGAATRSAPYVRTR